MSDAPPKGSWEWWRQATKEEMWAYIEETDEEWRRMGFGRRRNRQRLPEPSLPVRSAPARREHVRHKQVNVKLTEEDHGRLEGAARVYGVRPATMAQLLVNRGVRAVLEDDEAECSDS
jgi:predicted HTH domain antitoxin